MAYAENTTVDFEKSIAEIVTLLRKAGADQIGQVEARAAFTLQFTMAERMVRFRVHFPDQNQVKKMTGPQQDPVRVAEKWRRQRGRALLLVIKAKLESVESSVETFEQAFLANVVMADGSTLYDRVKEPIAVEYRTHAPVPMLLTGPGGAA
jgi:hypothetical protein